MANTRTTFTGNYANNRLKIANHNVAPKYVSVWSSGLTSSVCLPHSNWAVQVWGASSWQENFDLISNGFNVVLSHVNAWYLDCGFGSWRTTGIHFALLRTSFSHIMKYRYKRRYTVAQCTQFLPFAFDLATSSCHQSQIRWKSLKWPNAIFINCVLFTQYIKSYL